MPHTSFATTDPYTQVLNALWAALEASGAFCALVPVGNRIKFTDVAKGINPIKTAKASADFPEVCIEPTVSADEDAKSSADAAETQTWVIKMATADMRLNAKCYPLRWAMKKALYAVGDTLGLDFVAKTRITTSMETDFDPIEGAETHGWVTTFSIQTTMTFAKVNGVLQD